jgi:hypothetical protein
MQSGLVGLNDSYVRHGILVAGLEASEDCPRN